MRFLFLLLTGCSTLAPKFSGSIWLHKPIPSEFCTKELFEYGIYRRLNDGNYEWVAYCSPGISDYLSSYKDDVELVEK